MAYTTGIRLTDSTWNPWSGCRMVSPGCAHCYMFRDKRRYGQDPTIVVRSKSTFYNPLKWKEPRRIFTCSWSDWFIEEADRWRDEVWEIIRKTPHHTYHILTKRPERILDHLPPDWGNGYDNVWLGVTAENQKQADRRIPILLSVPAKVRFLTCEPLLGPIHLDPKSVLPHIHWVIVGGESGHRVRPMHPAWARSLRDQCVSAGIPFHFKQWGASCPEGLSWRPATHCVAYDGSVCEIGATDSADAEPMVYVGISEKVAPLLDGEEWMQFPVGA